ncbi:hypothetical protein AAG906_005881 [Vitis piasezkii]
MLLLCLDRASADQVMREVHAGVCGPHMGGHMLARKIMRTGYFWLTMETNCCRLFRDAVLPVEIEMGSLRVALEQQIPEVDWLKLD